MYDGFASIYDQLMDDVDYDAWAEYYLTLCRARLKRLTSLVDCACGTGSMTLAFARRGLSVIGVDRSEAMLSVAAEKARHAGLSIPWIHQDMRSLALHRPTEALLVCCDGVNYLLSEREVKAFFHAAAGCIAPGGLLAFDVSTRYKLQEQMGNAFFGEERDDIAYLWQNTFDEASRRIHMDLTFFVRQPNGLYSRFTENHSQRAHEASELVEWLTECGFTDIALYGERTLCAPTPTASRIHIVAKNGQ